MQFVSRQMLYISLCTFLLYRNCYAVLFKDIKWVNASLGESQSAACIRKGYQPLQMHNYPMVWNETIFLYIVTDLLKENVVNTSYGLRGCCAPGLWCGPEGCFTQGYGPRFDNYGWLDDTNASHPVYTCVNSGTASSFSISKQTLTNGTLIVHGSNFSHDAASISLNLDGEPCDRVQTCTCSQCSGDSQSCPTGQQCLTTGNYSNCFTTCAGSFDQSCPCGYQCTEVERGGADGTSTDVNLCLPPDFSATQHQTGDLSCAQDTLMCRVPSIYQSRFVGRANVTLTLAVDNEAVEVVEDARPLFPLGAANAAYCATDGDCADGNVCTVDSCSAATGLCEYLPAGGCESTPQEVRERSAPTVFLDLYFRNRSVAHAAFTEQMLELGTVCAAGSSCSISPLSFSLDFFGNRVNSVTADRRGALLLPPLDLDAHSAIFTTATNVVSPWTADWQQSSSSALRYHEQSSDGVGALHVLFSGQRLRGSTATVPESNFSASLFTDGSVRLSYLAVSADALDWPAFTGLWGSLVSSESQGDYAGGADNLAASSRYRSENVSLSLVESGLDAVFCPVSALACIPESCVAVNDTLVVRWNGTDSCAALGPDVRLRVGCEWAGGVARTEGLLWSAPVGIQELSTVSCTVPPLEFDDGTVLSVALVVDAYIIDSSMSTSEQLAAQSQFDAYRSAPGAKSIFGVTWGSNRSELARSDLMVRYFNGSNQNASASCGCSPLSSYGGLSCDAMAVCGGGGLTQDCAGAPFGSAYESACSTCTGGLTGVPPVFTCPYPESSSRGRRFLSLISQTIILLMIICCLTVVTSSVSFSVRRLLVRRRAHDAHEADFMEDYIEMLRAANGGAGDGAAEARGLSEFECDALGEVVFTREFYLAHKKAQLEAMHGVQGGAASTAGTESSEADLETGGAPPSSSALCDCPICLMDIQEGNLCRALPDPCGHVFHRACIDQWFRQSTNCPLCKRNMRAILEGTYDGDYDAGATREAEQDNPTARSIAALERIRTTLLHLATDRGVPSHHRGPNGSASRGGGGMGDYSSQQHSGSSNAAVTRVAFERAPQDEDEATMVRNRDRGTFDI